MGYSRAGFQVVGVDHVPQRRYPFPFILGDALDVLTRMLAGEKFLASDGRWYGIEDFDAIHASPPCQRYSEATPKERRGSHPDLVAPIRLRLELSGLSWVIENVPGAPLRVGLKLYGGQFGLQVERERWFECSWPAFGLLPTPAYTGETLNTTRSNHGPFFRKHGRVPTRAEIGLAMGIDWMKGDEIKGAIPPAYTEWIGRRLMEYLEGCGPGRG